MKKLLASLLCLALITSCWSQPELEVRHYLSDEMAPLNLPFSDAVIVGDMIYLSGQVGNIPGKLELVPGGLEAEAHQTMKNIEAVLKANGSSLEHTVKFTIMIDDMSQWGDFNKIYKTYFDGEMPARSAFGSDGLALGATVEVECIAYIPR